MKNYCRIQVNQNFTLLFYFFKNTARRYQDVITYYAHTLRQYLEKRFSGIKTEASKMRFIQFMNR